MLCTANLLKQLLSADLGLLCFLSEHWSEILWDILDEVCGGRKVFCTFKF
jgi:hypothetical protein